MSHSDPIADMLARIRNALMRRKSTVSTPSSKIRRWILDVLLEEGFIRGYDTVVGQNGHPQIEIQLKYDNDLPVIQEIQRISKPGKRVYGGANAVPFVRNGLGLSILSTSKGVMTDKTAREHNVGGEILCTVF